MNQISKAPKDKLIIKSDGGNIQLDSVLSEVAFGSTDNGFITGAFQSLANLTAKGDKLDEGELQLIAGALVGIAPQNALEGLLASQLVAVHLATMKSARRLAVAQYPEQRDAAERALNRLARTFTMQLETLHKLRNGGQQRVTVEHVHVEAGGQAIVGNVTTGAGP